jgi:murein DD-endopeptidase MepM/ murein hydrolase activator NlpD
VVNPYAPPPLGSDDPHQGVDLVQLLPGSDVAVAGLPVCASLASRVAGVVRDRFPYGNALLVETPLDALPPAWLEGDVLPASGATPQARSSLTCPPADPQALGIGQGRSLYLLYAHLQEAPDFQPGDVLECGQVIGAIGSSGNALNPHLHLEARVGPSGAIFAGLAHYDTRATPAEMGDYCLWRVSGAYLPLDPLSLLGDLP